MPNVITLFSFGVTPCTCHFPRGNSFTALSGFTLPLAINGILTFLLNEHLKLGCMFTRRAFMARTTSSLFFRPGDLPFGYLDVFFRIDYEKVK